MPPWAIGRAPSRRLERGVAEHDFSMARVKIAPWFQSLRGEPVFLQILATLRLN
jgi:hypothetical protein